MKKKKKSHKHKLVGAVSVVTKFKSTKTNSKTDTDKRSLSEEGKHSDSNVEAVEEDFDSEDTEWDYAIDVD